MFFPQKMRKEIPEGVCFEKHIPDCGNEMSQGYYIEKYFVSLTHQYISIIQADLAVAFDAGPV